MHIRTCRMSLVDPIFYRIRYMFNGIVVIFEVVVPLIYIMKRLLGIEVGILYSSILQSLHFITYSHLLTDRHTTTDTFGQSISQRIDVTLETWVWNTLVYMVMKDVIVNTCKIFF